MMEVLMMAAALVAGARDGDVGGRVVRDGKPVAGAVVMVLGVGRQTVWYFPADHHRDLSVWTKTDDEGRFTLPRSDASETLSAVILGPEGGSARLSLPAENEIIELKDVAPAAGLKPGRVHVKDSEGRPVRGALVLPTKMYFGGLNGGWGGELCRAARFTDGAGNAAVIPPTTHGHGEVEIPALSFRVVADGYAPAETGRVDLGGDVEEVRLASGCRVIGRVVGPDGPAPGVWVEGAQTTISGETIFLRFRAKTDGAGEFVFEHVPAGVELWIACPAWGNGYNLAAPVAKITMLGNGETLDAGRFRLEKGRSIGGRVVAERGGAIPKNLGIALCHEGAWLAWAAPLADDGTFSFQGVPNGGPYTLSVCGPEIMLSTENAAVWRSRYNALRGMVTRDNTEMEILLAPFSEDRENFQPRRQPLRGVESERAQ